LYEVRGTTSRYTCTLLALCAAHVYEVRSRRLVHIIGFPAKVFSKLKKIKMKSIIKDKKEGTNFVSMPVINTHAAGIDVGSRSHFAAVGQELSDVREFGVYVCLDTVQV